MFDVVITNKETLRQSKSDKPDIQNYSTGFIKSERTKLIKFFNDDPGTAYNAIIIINTIYEALARIYGRIGIENLPGNLRQKYNEIVAPMLLTRAIKENLKNYILNELTGYSKNEIEEALRRSHNLELGLKEWINDQVLKIDNYLANSNSYRNDVTKFHHLVQKYHNLIVEMFDKITHGFAASLLLDLSSEDFITNSLFGRGYTSKAIYDNLNTINPDRIRHITSDLIRKFNQVFSPTAARIGYVLLEKNNKNYSNELIGLSTAIVKKYTELFEGFGPQTYDFGSAKLPYNVDFIFPETPRSKKIKEVISSLPDNIKPSLVSLYSLQDNHDRMLLDAYRKILVQAEGSYGEEAVKAISTMLVIERAKLNLYSVTRTANPEIIKSLKGKIAVLEELKRQETLNLIDNIDTKRDLTKEYVRNLLLDANELSRGVAAAIEEVTDYALKNQFPEIISLFLLNLEKGLIFSTEYASKTFIPIPRHPNIAARDRAYDLAIKPLSLFDLHRKYKTRSGFNGRPFDLEGFKRELIHNASYFINSDEFAIDQMFTVRDAITQLFETQKVGFIQRQLENVFLKQTKDDKIAKLHPQFLQLFSTDSNAITIINEINESRYRAFRTDPIINSESLLSPSPNRLNISNKKKPTGLLNIPETHKTPFEFRRTYSPTASIPTFSPNQRFSTGNYTNTVSSHSATPFILNLPKAYKPVGEKPLTKSYAPVTSISQPILSSPVKHYFDNQLRTLLNNVLI
ncbi:MAG: hypothetical protein QXH92_04845 [Candidatus Aenigmatarchaeota archaeon]